VKVKKKHDKEIGHSVLPEDILNLQIERLYKQFLGQVMQRLGTSKTDLIISKMAGPLNKIDKNGAILDRLIRNWYDILNENGLMFIQFNYQGNTDTNTQLLVQKWADAIKSRFPEIDIQLDVGVMRLHKRAGSPEHLPPATQLFSKIKKEEGSQN